MRTKRSWLLSLLILVAIFLLLDSSELVKRVFRQRATLLVQLLDAAGIPSGVLMPDVSCLGCNNFDKRYLIDVRRSIGSAECSADHEIFLLVLCLSHSQNFERRKAVRQTWGSVSEYKGRSVRTFFICGRTNSSAVEAKLAEEAAYWGDIVQIDDDDLYIGLTNKTVAAFKWAVGHCGIHYRFLLKTDDDSFNVPQHFIDYLETVADGYKYFVGGLCASGEEPNRIKGHKWHVPFSAYPGAVYPLHCKGRAYILSAAAVMRIVSVSKDVLFNTMEDVYITGVCRAAAKISCTCIPGIPRLPETLTECDVLTQEIKNMHPVLPNKMIQMWMLVNNKTAHETCVLTSSNNRSMVTAVMCSSVLVFLGFVCYRKVLKTRQFKYLIGAH